MADDKKLNPKALKAACLALVCSVIVIVIVNGILNLVDHEAFFAMKGAVRIIVLIVIAVSSAVSAYRNVCAGKPWYGGKE